MSKPETLHTCPTCHTPGFTSRGLKAHRCDGKNRTLSAPAATATDHALMGRQLSEQYQRAVGGLKEVVIFGAMMMRLRELHPEMTKVGRPGKKLSTADNSPLSLSAWLETYAPDVKRPTALRFLHVTEAICADYAQIVGAKTAKQISLPDLVTTPAKQLPKGCEEKQLSLFEYINGTSQRSWLDRFSPESPQKRGSASRSGDKPRAPTTAELAQAAEDELTTTLNQLDAWFTAAHHTRITPKLRQLTQATLEGAIQKLKEVK